MPKLINVQDILDGMIVAEPVVNSFGQTLIGSGTILKKNHSKTLRTWNIHHISIKSDSTEEDLEISNEQKLLAAEKIAVSMNWTPRIKIEEDLFDMAVMHHCLTNNN